jgi:hypothetical protein
MRWYPEGRGDDGERKSRSGNTSAVAASVPPQFGVAMPARYARSPRPTIPRRAACRGRRRGERSVDHLAAPARRRWSTRPQCVDVAPARCDAATVRVACDAARHASVGATTAEAPVPRSCSRREGIDATRRRRTTGFALVVRCRARPRASSASRGARRHERRDHIANTATNRRPSEAPQTSRQSRRIDTKEHVSTYRYIATRVLRKGT